VKTDDRKDVHRIFVSEGYLIDRALEQGVREAMLRHKREGRAVVIYRNGRAEHLKPEDLGY
jgi:hypothetical protein